jgi:hypothetical protein
MPQNIMIDTAGAAHVIDKEWQLNAPLELGHLFFRSFIFMCDSVHRFGRSADGKKYTVFEFFGEVCEVVGLKISQHDMDRYAKLESKIQSSVSGISTQDFFAAKKSKYLPTETLVDVLLQRELELQQSKAQIAAFHASSSWRLMAPFRQLSDWYNKFTGAKR